MASEQVVTLDNPAGLLLPLEMLQQIGIGAGDQIEISVGEGTLTVRSVAGADAEKKNATDQGDARTLADEDTTTYRELIIETLAARGIQEVARIQITLANGQTLLFDDMNNPQLDDVVRRMDIRAVKLFQSAHAAGRNMDEIMESIMDRHDTLFRRLAEGVK